MKIDIFSHEIKSYIASTKGVISLLEKTSLTTEQTEYVKLLKSNNENTLALLNNNLYYDRIQNSSFDLLEETFDLHDQIKEIIALYAFQVHNKNIDITYKIDSSVWQYIYADRQKIRQILLNLFNNSIKFTKKGLIYLSLSMLEQQDDKYRIAFRIQDTGPGVDKNIENSLFDKYVTTRNGTGLGLYISKKIVKLMDGNIGYKYDNGATFFFDIWIKKDPQMN